MSIEIVPLVDSIPAKNEEDCCEGVDGEQEPKYSENEGGENPRSRVAMTGIKRLSCSEYCRYWRHVAVTDRS